MNKNDENKIVNEQNSRYEKYGYSPKVLGWDKGKQDLRFSILTSQYNDFQGKRILDVGCGFGDFKLFLDKKISSSSYSYTGIDLNENLIQLAKEKFENGEFYAGNYLNFEPEEKFDYAVSSGMFNYRFDTEGANDKFIYDCMKKTFELCNEGFAFDFLSDKVDYRYEHAY